MNSPFENFCYKLSILYKMMLNWALNLFIKKSQNNNKFSINISKSVIFFLYFDLNNLLFESIQPFYFFSAETPVSD